MASVLIFLMTTFVSSVVAIMIFFRVIMTRYSHLLVEISFFTTPVVFFAGALLQFMIGESDLAQISGIIAAVVSVMMLCVYFWYKPYIPFAAANIKTAATAIQSHSGLHYLAAFGFLVVLNVWFVLWSMAISGVYNQAQKQDPVPCPTSTTDTSGDGMCQPGPNPIVVILLLLSFYWTYQVLRNILHCTTAGTIGSWWFTPSSSSGGGGCCCSREVTDSLFRACTYSFGSICLGSLLVAIMQTLEHMLDSARRNNRGAGALLLCILECIVALLRTAMEYFQSWAFVYVGLYGYDFITAGKNVMKLFRDRGWTTFISDRLVFRVLFFCQLAIAVTAGCLSFLVDVITGPTLGDAETSHILTFWVGFLFGLVMSGMAIFVVESAVRTVMVLFAESPAALGENHPHEANAMVEGWSVAYPDLCRTTAVATAIVVTPNSDEEHARMVMT